jgi:hypothetical protein
MTGKDLKGNGQVFFTYPVIYEISVGIKTEQEGDTILNMAGARQETQDNGWHSDKDVV